MPFHRIYCPPDLYTKEDKQAIAKAITKTYENLPPFLVVVNFIEVSKDNYYVGGEANDRFVRITVLQMDIHMETPQQKRARMESYERAIEPWTKGREIDWELRIFEEDRVLWNSNGISIPPRNSEPYLTWKKLNRPVEWEGENLV